MRKLFLTISFFLLFCIQVNNQIDRYNLTFKDDNTVWFRTDGIEIMTDSISGKMYLVGKEIFDGVRLPIIGAIYQTIFLPDITNENIFISLKAKSLNLSNSFLKVSAYDSCENEIYNVSSYLRKDSCNTEINIPAIDVRFIKIMIGVDDIHHKMRNEQALFLNQMEIRIGGKNIETLLVPESHAKIDQQEINAINRDFSLNQYIKNNQIIGIGETVHGNMTFGKCFFELSKDMIINSDCRLIIMELSSNFMLKWNLFITDNADFTYEELVADMYQSSYSPELFFEMFQWLKKYNENRGRKIRILGMDRAISDFRSKLYWADYIFHFMKKNNDHPLLDSLSTFLIRNEFEKAKLIAQQSEIKRILGEEEWNFFIQALPKQALISFEEFQNNLSSTGYFGDADPIEDLREKIMFSNVQEAIVYGLKENEKTIIYGHLGHIGNHTFLGSTKNTLGYHLSHHYGDQYFRIGLLTGIGTYTAVAPTGTNGLLSQPDLQPPDPNSLEYFCMETGSQYFFCPVNAVSEKILRIRGLGRLSTENQFREYVSLENRMDAFIFVKESQGIHIPELWVDTDLYGKKRMDRFENTMERNRFPRDH